MIGHSKYANLSAITVLGPKKSLCVQEQNSPVRPLTRLKERNEDGNYGKKGGRKKAERSRNCSWNDKLKLCIRYVPHTRMPF